MWILPSSIVVGSNANKNSRIQTVNDCGIII